MKNIIEILIQLGESLASLPQECIDAAEKENEWFSREEIEYSVEAIRSKMLNRASLEEWVARYPSLPTDKPKDVAIIMAGNIPLVGLLDLICTLVAGDRAWIKPSSKDSQLMLFVKRELECIEPSVPIYIYDDSRHYDMVIATGGESANRYFQSRFRGAKCLTRSDRHSIAVLSGSESDEDMALLSDDIYRYSGLGCRSISMIFTPRGSRFIPPCRTTSLGYRNNYLQSRALLTLSGKEFIDNGSSLFVKSQELPHSLSTISVFEYDTLQQVEEWIESHDEQLQCIVSREIKHQRCVGFGEAQHPTLMDYPDAIDIIEFLIN